MKVIFVLNIIVPLFTIFGIPAICSSVNFGKPVAKTWLYAASALYMISWFLPQPLIEGQNTQFTTHLVGGGCFTACIWTYLRSRWPYRIPWLLQSISLFALVSMLGVANELFELGISQLGILAIDPSDTWWDLLANTLGAFGLGTAIMSIPTKNKTA